MCLLCGIYKARALGYLSSQVFPPYILVSIDIFDVSRGTTSSHSKEMQTAAYSVKSDTHGGWMASSVESSCPVWNSTLMCYKYGAGYVEHLQGSLFLRLFFQGYSR